MFLISGDFAPALGGRLVQVWRPHYAAAGAYTYQRTLSVGRFLKRLFLCVGFSCHSERSKESLGWRLTRWIVRSLASLGMTRMGMRETSGGRLIIPLTQRRSEAGWRGRGCWNPFSLAASQNAAPKVLGGSRGTHLEVSPWLSFLLRGLFCSTEKTRKNANCLKVSITMEQNRSTPVTDKSTLRRATTDNGAECAKPRLKEKAPPRLRYLSHRALVVFDHKSARREGNSLVAYYE